MCEDDSAVAESMGVIGNIPGVCRADGLSLAGVAQAPRRESFLQRRTATNLTPITRWSTWQTDEGPSDHLRAIRRYPLPIRVAI